VTETPSAPNSRTVRFRLLPTAGWLLAYCSLALATHTYVLLHPMPCDNCVYIRYSRDWSDGAKLYTDRYEPKTPVVFWLFRLIDSPSPRLSVYFAGAVLVAFAGGELRRALLKVAPLGASIAPVFLIVWSGAIGFQHLYDAFVVPLAVLAFAWLGRAVESRSVALYPGLAGVAFAIVVGLYPPTAAYAIAFLPLLIQFIRQHGWRSALRAVASCIAGFSLVWGFVVSHALTSDYWDGFLDAMAATSQYGEIGRVSVHEHKRRWSEEMTRFVEVGGPILATVVLASAIGIVLKWRGLNGKVWVFTTLLWFAAAQLGTFPGGRHFTNYYAMLIGPLAALGGLGLAALSATREIRRGIRVLLVAYAVVAVGFNAFDNYQLAKDYRMRSPSNARTQVTYTGEFFDLLIPQNELVVVCVWGNWAELYWRVPRPSPSRHIIPWNLAETRPEFFDEWARDVLANLPEWIVTDNSLLGPGVTDEEIRKHSDPFGARAMLTTPSFAKLRAIVRSDYEVVNGMGGCFVLKRIKSEKPRP